MPKLRWSVEIPHCLIIASMFAVAAIVWRSLPDRLPVHWSGLPPAIPFHPDSYGGKFHALLLWPLIALALYPLLLFAPKLSPDRYEGAEGTPGWALLRMCVTALIAANYFAFVRYAEGYPVDLQSVDRDGLLIFMTMVMVFFVWQLVRRHS